MPRSRARVVGNSLGTNLAAPHYIHRVPPTRSLAPHTMSWKNAPHFAASFPMCGLAAAIVTTTDAATPGVYTADLKRDWCIGFGSSLPPSLPPSSANTV